MTRQLSTNDGAFQPWQEVIAPALRQGGCSNRLLQEIAVVSVPDEKPVHFGDRYAVTILRDQFKRIAYAHFAFLFHRKIESAASANQEALNHVITLKLGR